MTTHPSAPYADTQYPTLELARWPYSVWAPHAQTVELVFVDTAPGELRERTNGAPVTSETWPISSRIEMTWADQGWWIAPGKATVEIQQAQATNPGYGYLIDGAGPFPDPRSRRQPDTVHGPSRLWEPDTSPATMPLNSKYRAPASDISEMVIYEAHPASFSTDGTLTGIIPRLPHLRDLGITHLELLPVVSSPGEFGWGYDGVSWYAIDETLGGPNAYRKLVAAAHDQGIGIIQDVVYNHWGPEGNYLDVFGPYSTQDSTRWGQGPNLDGPGSDTVRTYILDQARMFLETFGIDGFRLDAVHALADTRAVHILEEIRHLADEVAERTRVPRFVIAESDLNDPRMIADMEPGFGLGMHGQWSDDFHHAVHTLITGETHGYYRDFAPMTALQKVLNNGFFHDGTLSTFRGRHHGRPIPAEIPPTRLVVSVQNHDQVGNRPVGDRPTATISTGRAGISAALMLLGPFTPMLFMGEEWGSTSPFPFFADYGSEELRQGLAEGRAQEFEATEFWDEAQVPDPTSVETAASARLDFEEITRDPAHGQLLDLYKKLIALRRAYREFRDTEWSSIGVDIDADDEWIELTRGVSDEWPDGRFALIINLAGEPLEVDEPGRMILGFGPDGPLEPQNCCPDTIAVDSFVVLQRDEPENPTK